MTTTSYNIRVPSTVPFEFAREHLVLVQPPQVGVADEGAVECLCTERTSPQALDNLSLLLGRPLKLSVRPEEQVRRAISQAYQEQMARQPTLVSTPTDAEAASADLRAALARLDDRDLLASADKSQVARLVDQLLFDALQKNASDLHVHPYPDKLIIRYRIDGVLHNVYEPAPALHEQIVGRIKVLSGMDVAEKRLPQDGRTSVRIGERQIDLRVSSLPTTCGERLVVRLLEQTARLKRLDELGMPKRIETEFLQALHRSHGLILVTGPTGSGKTTTIYSALAQLDATQQNILTVEDPVEYQLPGISQTQVSDKKGLTFLSGLRHMLRQDPDVILVGEVRDEPTARMVLQASLTGHLVLTTLHTNDAAGAVARLVDLGIEPYLIASSLLGVLAQRLVRKTCRTCTGKGTDTDGIICAACDGIGSAGQTRAAGSRRLAGGRGASARPSPRAHRQPAAGKMPATRQARRLPHIARTNEHAASAAARRRACCRRATSIPAARRAGVR